MTLEVRKQPAVPRIAVVLHMIENQPFGGQFKEDFEAEVAQSGQDLRLEFADSHGSVAEQVGHLERFLKAGVDALVLWAIGPEAVKPSLRLYAQAKIPVVLVSADVGEHELYRCIIQPNNLQFGRKMGEFFAEVSGERAEIVEIRGIATSEPARLRSAGFKEVVACHPGMHLIASLTADWQLERAREVMARWLPSHPEVDCIFAQNDEMASGAWEAAHALGRESELLITGIDAIKGQGLSMVMQGKLAATLINPSAGRPTAVQLLALLAGEPVLERTVLQTSLLRSHERIRAWREQRGKRSGAT